MGVIGGLCPNADDQIFVLMFIHKVTVLMVYLIFAILKCTRQNMIEQ